jgi:peptide deformylase
VLKVTTKPEDLSYLTQRSDEVEHINFDTLNVIAAMKAEAQRYNYIGVAANEVGIMRRVMIVDRMGGMLLGQRSWDIHINPVIIRASEETWAAVEGCGSIPGMLFRVRRPMSIQVRYLTLKGKEINETLHYWVARIFQHELDHLDGLLISQKGTPTRALTA